MKIPFATFKPMHDEIRKEGCRRTCAAAFFDNYKGDNYGKSKKNRLFLPELRI